MQTIFLKEEECYCQLDKFYANVAKHLGYDVPYGDEKHTFDCRKICITPSAYQKIKEFSTGMKAKLKISKNQRIL